MAIISVVVPVYKVEQYLCRCIDSILSQTFTDFDLILVDDGSPDGCGKICDDYAEKDSRIFVIHKKNGGLSSARNSGIDWAFKNSNSNWITFIDSDDWVHTQYLELLLYAIKCYNTNVSVSIHKKIDKMEKEKEICKSDICIRIEDANKNYCNDLVHAWGKLYKKDLFKNIRFPIGKLHEDAFVTYLILFEAKKYAVIDYPLYNYYTNPNGITYQYGINRLDEFEAYEQQLSFFKSKGHNIIAERTLNNYFYRLYFVYNILQNTLTGEDLKLCNRRVIRSIRRVLIKYVPKEKRYKYAYWYELAFPILFKIGNRIKRC